MQQLLEYSGATGYLLLLAAMAGWPVALGMIGLSISRKTMRAALVLAGLVAGIGVAALLIGLQGEQSGMRGSYRAVAHAAPEDREVILAASASEAKACTTLGLLGGGPLTILAALVVGVSFARTGKPS